jgi:hypothetical protein
VFYSVVEPKPRAEEPKLNCYPESEPKLRIAAPAPSEEVLKYESVVKQQIPIFLYFMPVIRIHNTGRNCIQINHTGTLAGKINSIVLGVNSAFPSMASPHPVPFVSFQQHL